MFPHPSSSDHNVTHAYTHITGVPCIYTPLLLSPYDQCTQASDLNTYIPHTCMQVFPDLPLDEWNRNVESLSDRTRKFFLESQIRVSRRGGHVGVCLVSHDASFCHLIGAKRICLFNPKRINGNHSKRTQIDGRPQAAASAGGQRGRRGPLQPLSHDAPSSHNTSLQRQQRYFM